MNETIKIKIKKDAHLIIFDELLVQERADRLFKEKDAKIKERIEEILKFIELEPFVELSYENILSVFKRYFYEQLLKDAIQVVLSEERKYNVLNNILTLLSEERLENAIIGETMIDACKECIRSIKTDSGLVASIHGTKILLLEKKFLA